MKNSHVVSRKDAVEGDMGQTYLATGKRVALRRWEEDPGEPGKQHRHGYETVGYLVSGVLELNLADQTLKLEPGDSWLVPEDALHSYRIIEQIVAVEATSPPARLDDKD